MRPRHKLTEEEERYLRGIIERRVGWRWPVPTRVMAKKLGVHRNFIPVLVRRLIESGRAQNVRERELRALDAQLSELRRAKKGFRWPVPVKVVAKRYRLPFHYILRRASYWGKQP